MLQRGGRSSCYDRKRGNDLADVKFHSKFDELIFGYWETLLNLLGGLKIVALHKPFVCNVNQLCLSFVFLRGQVYLTGFGPWPLIANVNFFLKKWAIPGLFPIYFRLIKQTPQLYSKKCENMSIQYTVLGFKPTTFRTSVSSHNH